MQKMILKAVPKSNPDETPDKTLFRIFNDRSLLNGTIDLEETEEREYSLSEMQKVVDGLIDVLAAPHNITPHFAMVINDEGKLDNRPFNYYATMLARGLRMIALNDYIVGDVLIASDSGDELSTLSDNDCSVILATLDTITNLAF